MNQDKNPLVSIIVITYNSAKFVLETLESAKAQTYQNIELIISDDCSSDNTIEICKEWLKNNKNRFVNTQVITVENNTGIAPNLNRGVKASNGEWIKSIAGDDILKPTIIADYLAYINSSLSEINFIYSNVQEFIDEEGERKFLPIKNLSKEKINDPTISTDEQLKILVYSNTVWAATWFYSRKLFDQLNGFDERYAFIEDYPFLIAMSKKGFKLIYLDIVGSLYRRHIYSIQKTNKILSNFDNDRILFRLENLSEYMPPNKIKKIKFLYEAKKVSIMFNNEKSFLSSVFIKFFYFKNVLKHKVYGVQF